MRRPVLILLLVLGVLCAGSGVALVVGALGLGGPAGFGWTAYSPLSGETYPPDLGWFIWKPRIGALLIALGAGTTGAVLAVIVLSRSARTR